MKKAEKVSVTIRGEGAITGKPFAKAVTGEKIGVFVVHRGTDNKKGKWVATHPGTGLAAITAPTKEVAVWGAQRLSDIDVDWSVTDKPVTTTWPEDVLKEIYIVVNAAKLGGMA